MIQNANLSKNSWNGRIQEQDKCNDYCGRLSDSKIQRWFGGRTSWGWFFVGSGEFQNISKILKNHEDGSTEKNSFICQHIFNKKKLLVNSHQVIEPMWKFQSLKMFKKMCLLRDSSYSRQFAKSYFEEYCKWNKFIGCWWRWKSWSSLVTTSPTDYGWDLRRKDPSAKKLLWSC